jgi:hypothetical protein
MQGRRRVRCVLLVPALAACAAPAIAQEIRTPAVWYRAAAECPGGPEFIAKIASNPARAHLAQGGDHIDFVVTLLTAQGETIGRLERQTNGGTVAIRELRDATCARVADALAMSLGLAMDPTPSASEPEAAAALPAPVPIPADTAAPTPTPATPATALQVRALPTPLRDRTIAPKVDVEHFFGLDFGILSGASTQPMARGSVFMEVDHALSGLAKNLALRVAAAGAFGTAETPVGPVQRWVLSGRGEVCPWRWGTFRVGLRPCLAFELGATSASSNRAPALADHGLWAAPGASLRGDFDVLPTVRLEAGGSALLPLLREQVFVGSKPLFQDALLAFQAALGVSVALP